MPHAFRQEISQNGIGGIYKGSFPFFITYTSFVILQFPIFENIMLYYKKRMTVAEYQANEVKLTIVASFLAGGIAAALTNPFECITVNMQTQSNFKIGPFVRETGFKTLCTSGLFPRVAYNSLQSVLLFGLVQKLGKIYNVDLGEE